MRRLLLAVSLLALPGCAVSSDEPVAPFSADVSLRTGTSFGHCLGYCEAELTIAGGELVLTRTSRDPAQYPPLTERLPLSAADREALAGSVDPAVFFSLEDVYGCPDCADGGAEWIEMDRGGERKRVTFEFGATVEPIAPLILRARELRERFGPPPGVD